MAFGIVRLYAIAAGLGWLSGTYCNFLLTGGDQGDARRIIRTWDSSPPFFHQSIGFFPSFLRRQRMIDS